MASQPIGLLKLNAREDRLEVGARLMAVAGLAVFLYGLAFLVLNFTSFTEIGLSKQLVGGDASSIQGYSPELYRYVSHLQVNIAAFLMSVGVMLTLLAWFGVRSGQRWALWAAVTGYFVGLAVGLPIHYVYGLGTLAHVGPFYLVTLVVIVGAWLAYSGTRRRRTGSLADCLSERERLVLQQVVVALSAEIAAALKPELLRTNQLAQLKWRKK